MKLNMIGLVIIVLGIIIIITLMYRHRIPWERFEAPSPSPYPMENDTGTEKDEESDSDDDDTELKKKISREKGKLKRSLQVPRATLEHDLDPGLKRDFAPFIMGDDEPQGDRTLEAKSVRMTMKGTPMSESPSPVEVEN